MSIFNRILLALLLFQLAPHTLAAPIPGLYNTGVDNNNNILLSGSIDPHWSLTQSADPSVPGPNAIVLNDSGFPIDPWVANGPNSKWIAPLANQGTGNPPGNYHYQISFNLAGLEPSSAVITGTWTSDNTGSDVLLNGISTGITSDGNFGAIANPFTLSSGFVDGPNTLEFIVNNAGTGANPTGVRIELSGTADLEAPPGTPPSILEQPQPLTVGLLSSATFRVSAFGARPLTYQWRFNGTPIPGANNPSLSISDTTASDSGSYDVVVTNAWGSATSQPATLGVVFLNPNQLSYEPLGPSNRRTPLTFSEIMYHPPTHPGGLNTEFIELYNSNPFFEDISGWRLTGDFDYTFPENTVIQGNSFLVVAPAPQDVETFYGISGVLGGALQTLPNSSGTLRLRKRSGGLVLETRYSDSPPWPNAADGTGHSLVLARPSHGENNPRAWEHSSVKGGSPGTGESVPAGPLENILINEILAHTDLPLLDFIELFNNSPLTADLSGCWLTDEASSLKFRIPDDTLLPPQQFLSFDESQLGFALEANGESIFLVNSNQSRVLSSLRFPGQANGVSYGRSPDGAPGFQELLALTPGAANATPWHRDVVINEIMYNPISGDDNDEYVELHNRGLNAVNIGQWQFVDGISFTFPQNTFIPPGGYLVIAKNTARMITNYPGLNPASLLGNYNGTLSNGGERIALAKPESQIFTNLATLQVTTNTFPIVVDEVSYVDGGRWTTWSDGGGSSLELIDPRSDNRQPSNWADSDETAKSDWTLVEHTGVLDNGNGFNNQLQAILFGEGEVLIDDVEASTSGANRIPNSDFESGVNGWFFQGTHRASSWETTEGFASSRSLHLRSSGRGDLAANRLRAPLTSAFTANQTVTLRARVRWLRGHPEILFRLKGNWLDTFGILHVPKNLGTPGAPNSQSLPNSGPAITDVQHHPTLPQDTDTLRVTARITDPDGLQSATLLYRVDPSPTLVSVNMVDDGTQGDTLAGDGLFTGRIPPQANGATVAFRIEARDAFTSAVTTRFPAEAPANECLVRVGEVPSATGFGTYRLWMTDATVATWAGRERLSNENLDATWVYGDSRVIYNIGAHYSGSSYTSPGYNSPIGNLCGYDLTFPDDDSFLSTTHVVLDWPVRDNTDQREQLMFWMLEQYGLPNMYRRYVVLHVNGRRRGSIYDDVQQPGGETVEQWFSNDTEGTLLKTDCWDEFNDAGDRETSCLDLNALELYTTTGGVKKTERYRWTWRPRSVQGSANDYTELFALVDAANAPDPIYQASMENLADMEHWMRTFAMNDLASYWDAFGNPNAKNTYLYKPQRDTWKLMCWDMDVGLGVFNDPVNAALFPNLNDDAMDRVYTNPAWTRLYWCALAEGVNTFFQSGGGTAINTLLDAKYAAFQAHGISLSSPNAIKSWINDRRAFLLGQLATVSSTFSIAGPTSITTSENLLTLSGTAPVDVHIILVDGIAYPVTWSTVNNWTLRVPLTQGTQLLTINGVNRFGTTNALATLNADYTGPIELAEDNILFNEIMHHPSDPEAEYIEIHNRSQSFAFDLSGWRVNGLDYTFPNGSIITSGQFLVLTKNLAAFSAAYGPGVQVAGQYNGSLDNDGETLTLFRPGASPGEEIVVDRVRYEGTPPWPTTTAGSGLSLQLIDPNQDNSRVSNWSDGAGWQLFSVTGDPSSGSTFFLWLSAAGELYLDDIELVRGDARGAGPNLLSNGDFESGALTPWSAGNNHSGSLVTTNAAHTGDHSLHIIATGPGNAVANVKQSISGVNNTSPYTLSFYYLPITPTGIDFRVDTRFRSFSSIPVSPSFITPGAPNASSRSLPPYEALWLNEIQPVNNAGILDGAGDPDPWIEVYNAGTLPISLDAYSLANNYDTLTQWTFPEGSLLMPGAFRLVWADNEPGESTPAEDHANFTLNPTTGSVALSRTVSGAPQIVDYINYSGIDSDLGYGSYPDGDPFFRRTLHFATPGQANDPAFPAAPVFINEWMASNDGYGADPADGDFEDWFELYNASDSAVELAGYQLTDEPTLPAKFIIPPGIRIAPRGFLAVWADEESSQTQTNGDLHVNFRLSAAGEVIQLRAPNGQLVDSVIFEAQTPDISEGRFPDGAPAPFFSMPTPTLRAPNQIPGGGGPDLIGLDVDLTLGTAILTWQSEPDTTYRVQFKNSLSDPTWTDLPGDVLATGTTATKTDPSIASINQRFYRVLTP